MTYTSILLAVDFSASADEIVRRALAIRDAKARMIVMHVVDHLPPLGFGEEPLIAPDWMIPEQTLLDEAKKSLANLCAKHRLHNVEQRVELGTAHHEIARIADIESCDLVVLGSHGRHGLQLLLGSTANGVLHHANCDVLAVRIKD